jgi:hypothetical protein
VYAIHLCGWKVDAVNSGHCLLMLMFQKAAPCHFKVWRGLFDPPPGARVQIQARYASLIPCHKACSSLPAVDRHPYCFPSPLSLHDRTTRLFHKFVFQALLPPCPGWRAHDSSVPVDTPFPYPVTCLATFDPSSFSPKDFPLMPVERFFGMRPISYAWHINILRPISTPVCSMYVPNPSLP